MMPNTAIGTVRQSLRIKLPKGAIIAMRILATFVMLCAIFCTACGSKPTNHEASVAAAENSYDAGIAAYKRGHYQAALYDLDPRANTGDPIAQFCLGFMYKYGLGVAANHGKAEEWYTKAAEQGYPTAQNNLGVMYVRRYEESIGNDPKTLETAKKWFQRAAEQGYAPAQFNLCIILAEADIGLEWNIKAANQGYPPAQDHLGSLYYHGNGIDKDLKESVKWYQAAAEQGYASSQTNLGICYSNGKGVKKNHEKAFKLYKQAAQSNYAPGQFELGRSYHLGEGVSVNLSQASRWYRAAAEQGNLDAQNNLGVIYSEHSKNPEMASRWYFRAAQQDHAIAQRNIGRKFEKGQDGLPQDSLEAYYWYSLALKDKAALKRDPSKDLVSEVTEALDRIGKSLKDAGKDKEINQIQEQADNWQPKQFSGAGTGFYVDKNHILTNAHVVISNWQEVLEGGKPIFCDEFRIPYRRVSLKVKAVAPEVDLALLYDERGNTDENGDAVIAKFRREPIEFGEKISLFGYPQSSRLSYEGNLTSGIVSGLSYSIKNLTPENGFQHTAPSQRGNSGGPVFDAEGHVIGVCVSILEDTEFVGMIPYMGVDVPQAINLAQNINFAIHYDVVAKFLRDNSIRPSGPASISIEERFEELIARSVPSTAEPLKEIPLVTIKTKAEKFTVPVLGFKHKTDSPLSVEEITIDELK